MDHTPPQRVIDRIHQRVETNEAGCWIWPGAKSVGYGRIAWSLGNRQMVYESVHRIMYEEANGPIPEGFDVHHICHDPAECHPEVATDCPHRPCCNPDHLRAVTRQENLLQGGTVTASRAARTHCPKGHPYDEPNTYVDKIGRRSCLACTYERNRRYYWKNRDKRRAYNAAWRQNQKTISAEQAQ